MVILQYLQITAFFSKNLIDLNKTGERSSQLLCSKSRVAQLKIKTIPRLELSACLFLVKLTDKVLAALKESVNSVQVGTDSSLALSWTNTHLLRTFVANGVSQIRQQSKDFQLRHISLECNPADTLSRGLDAMQDAVEISIISSECNPAKAGARGG
ncbi:transposon Ty3-I Gag-Pol polyprotein [Trichonephila inaurata madagascariensis]|uniref:Transposon Ty3-I Gag-Pol polyprotein n=1 Tax=Trichonephila inaurata madagascariensis TaxID=2747483 RepID=A0A8X7CP86_9ARAC|nr:transposon Ty3-I Gag-Pol polyprotein [Trichonephila inaurata madagascariensis]